MKLRALFTSLILFLSVSVVSVAQTATPPTQTPPPPPLQQPAPEPRQQSPQAPPSSSEAEAGAPQAATAPETKITKAQADELFRSVDEILKFASQDTGLPIKHPVKRQLADRDTVQHFIEMRMKEDKDAKRLERSEVVLKKFGLVPRDFNLRKFMVDLLKEQVAGFYDAKTKTVYLLDWVEPEQQKPVLAHELTHALQDQNFGLEELSKRAKKDDPTGLAEDERLAADSAVTEGQAMLVLLDYSLVPMGSSVVEQPQLVDAMQAALTASGPSMVMFNRAPLFLKEVLLFPYRYGTLFVRDVLVASGKEKAFTETLKNPPQDTQQILQPQSYLRGQYVAPGKPIEMEKLARDYKKWDLSAMGQFDVMLLLNQYGLPDLAKSLSSQWRGGYYWAALVPSAAKETSDSPRTGQIAMMYLSDWADAPSAERFAAAYSEAIPTRYSGAHTTSAAKAAATQEAAGTGMRVSVTPRLAGRVTWQTSEGEVTVEPHGNKVLVLESFDPETAARIRDAAFGK